MKATDLSIGDIGKTFRSPVYRDNNKTSLPIGQFRSRVNRKIVGEPEIRPWTLTEIYAHSNGNIKINNGYHLREDTEIERMN